MMIKDKFAKVKLDKVDIHCNPEVFALGCFFEPIALNRLFISKYLKEKLGNKFSKYGLPQAILFVCYSWFLPKVEHHRGKIIRITNRFWTPKSVGTIANKLPTLRNKEFVKTLGISNRNTGTKIEILSSTGIIKSYIGEAKNISPCYTNIRFVELNVPLFLSIAYTKEDLGTIQAIMLNRKNESSFMYDVAKIISKAYELNQDKDSIRSKFKLDTL